MAMIRCPECGREISSLAPVCLGCGITQETVQKLLAEKQEKQQSIVKKSSAHKEQINQVKTIVQPSVHTEKVQISPAGKQNRTIRCVICRNTYHSADTAVCPKCKYPFLSLERNSRKIKQEICLYKGQSTSVKTIVRPAVHTEKVQVRPEEKQNRTIRCVICRNTYHSADTAVCPKCKYPFLSPERNSRKIKQEIRTYRKQNGYQLLELTIGQTYRMGRYQGEEITWKVLAVEEDKALLISEKELVNKQYNEIWKYVTWETCTLRKWLNTDFLNSAFTSEDRNKIAVTKVRAEKNPKYDTNPGNDTEDKIFLLSIEESLKYFNNDERRKAVPTEFARKNGAYVDSSTGCCWWWLRSPGDNSSYAAFVNYDGSVYCAGYVVNLDIICVRPALWVNL